MVGEQSGEMVNNPVFPVSSHALPCHIFRVLGPWDPENAPSTATGTMEIPSLKKGSPVYTDSTLSGKATNMHSQKSLLTIF